jgi:Fukutin N-terminal
VSVFTLNGSENMANNVSDTGSFVPLHVLLSHTNGHTIHVVIFHQRGEITYWWHGHLVLSSDNLYSAIANSTFVTREGSYSRYVII